MSGSKVLIIVGSDSDLPLLEGGAKVLEEFGIPYRIRVGSAHRSPEHVKACVREAEAQGAQAIIAVAGMAAALPGVVASETTLPVIGVPVEGRSLSGMDALFSMAQMPQGIPVATVAIGRTGAVNAAILAVQILALSDAALREKFTAYRAKMTASVLEKDGRLQGSGLEKYLKEKNQ